MQYFTFFRYKNYNKTIIFINITIFTIEKIIIQNAVTLINKGFTGFLKTLLYCVYGEYLTCPLWIVPIFKKTPLKNKNTRSIFL